MAETGYEEQKVQLLIATNWIRTGAFLIQAAMAAAIALRAIHTLTQHAAVNEAMLARAGAFLIAKSPDFTF